MKAVRLLRTLENMVSAYGPDIEVTMEFGPDQRTKEIAVLWDSETQTVELNEAHTKDEED